MLDWEGLLKFTLSHTDGTSKSQFKERSKEDQKWLESALSEYCNSEIQRIQFILKTLDQNTVENKVELLEELQQLLQSLDRGNILYAMSGHIILLRIIFYDKNQQSRCLAMQILSAVNQNDSAVQTQSINSGALELIELIETESNMKIKQNMMSLISALIRGENLQAKRIFIGKLNGLNIIQKYLLSKDSSQRLKNKVCRLLQDLYFYDDNLHKTYNNLQAFNNTNKLDLSQDQKKKKKEELTYDPNQDYEKINLDKKNQHFKGIIKKWLNQNMEVLNIFITWKKQNEIQ